MKSVKSLAVGVGRQNLAAGAQHKVDGATDNCVNEDDGGAG